MQSQLALRGPRLRLRPWRYDDIDAAVEWNNDPLSLRYAHQERRDEPYHPYTAAEIELVYRATSTNGWLFIAMRGNRRAGEFALTLNGPEPGSARIDFLIAPAYRGRGLGREGVAICANFALSVLKVPKLYGYVAAGNVASERLHRSLGYRRQSLETKRPFVLGNTPAARARLRKLLR
jgi:RimJ/RimL family protein N-acetyltransferase